MNPSRQRLFALLGTALLLGAPILQRWLSGSPLLPAAESYTLLAHLDLSPVLALGLSLLLGLLTSLLACELITGWTRSTRTRLFALFLFLLTPGFAATFTRLTPFALGLPLLLLLLKARRPFWKGLLALLFALVTPTLALLSLAALLLVTRRRVLLPGLLVALPLALLTGTFRFSEPFVSLGVVGGFSLLIVTLALIDAVRRWEQDEQQALLYFALLLLAFWNPAALLLASFASVPGAARTLSFLVRRRWRLIHARELTLLLLACSLLFLVVVHETSIAAQEPLKQTVATLEAAPSGVLLAPARYAPIVRAFSKAEPLVTDCQQQARLCKDVARLYRAKRLPAAAALLQQYNITSLLVTTAMRDGGVWRHDEDGLLFLLKHSDAFRLLAKHDGRELWGYSPQGELLAGAASRQ